MQHFAAEPPQIFRNGFFIFIMMVFFFCLADATMSYAAPLLMQHRLGATTMGLILSTSSMFGTITDFSFAKFFGHKKPRFFLKIMLSLGIFFPISFLIFQTIPSFLFGMFIWGVYYEALVFSDYHSIHQMFHPKDHIWAWGTLATVKNISWVAGPLIGAFLDNIDSHYPYFLAIFGYSAAMFLFLFHKRNLAKLKTKFQQTAEKKLKQLHQHTFGQEVRLWFILGRVFWPLLFMMFMFEIIDATFFSIGPAFGDQLQQLTPLGNLFITMYTLPSLLFGVLTGFLARPFGKKRAAFGAGLIAGGGFIALSQVHSVPLILATTFFGSMGMAIIFPEISAIFQDYMARSKNTSNDIVGITAVMASISYVIGPIVNGFLADRIGTQKVFGLWGGIMAVFSLIAIFTVKRKLLVPQRELALILRPKKR